MRDRVCEVSLLRLSFLRMLVAREAILMLLIGYFVSLPPRKAGEEMK